MSKELPYFKFNASRWLIGNIHHEDFETQGLFISICALYWDRDGELTLKDIEKRYRNANAECINILVEDYLRVEDGRISIDFLDEQFHEREELSIRNAKNGAKGGKAKSENLATASDRYKVATKSLSENVAKRSNIEREKEEDKEYKNNSTKVLLSAEPTAQTLKNEWEELSKNLPADIRGQWESIKTFIEEKKPGFIHPYATIWNVFAGKYGLSQIKAVEGGRSRKFNVRIKEPPFDFLQILDGIRKSTFCRGENKSHWRVDWDWIMENGTNYLKIIENKFE